MKELMVLGFLLTAPMTSNAESEREAYRYAAEAFYQQSELDKAVDAFVQKKVPKKLQIVSSHAFLIAKSIQEKKVTYSFTF